MLNELNKINALKVSMHKDRKANTLIKGRLMCKD